MSDGPPDREDGRLDAEIRAVAGAMGRDLEGHPSAQELLDYHLGALPAEEADRIQDHLGLCPQCAQAVLDFAAFSSPPEGAPRTPAAELDREWGRLQARMKGEPAPIRPLPTLPPAVRWLLAASLLAVLGLLGWNFTLRRNLEEAHRPRADVVLADLTPEEENAERSAEAPRQVHVPANEGKLVLLLNLGDIREFPRYRMELVAPGGEVAWADPDVPRSEDGSFVLEIPAAALEPKTYRVRLYGQIPGKEEHLASYSFEVVREARIPSGK